MDRIKDLSLYGKLLLLAMIAMAIVFAVVYPAVTSREGYLYEKQILVPATENGNTTYSAKVKGEQWCFTVTPDKTVTFRCGDKLYGPYTAKEDATAIPADHQLAHLMTGVEVRCGEEILFRGGIFDTGSYWIMTNEDGTSHSPVVSITSSNGTVVDSDGKVIDPMKPSVSTILKLMNGPELTHKGHGGFWFLGVFISLIAAAYILFADELFRLQFIFQVRDPDMIEPSDWELGMRPVAWTIMVLAALIIYIMGLSIGT